MLFEQMLTGPLVREVAIHIKLMFMSQVHNCMVCAVIICVGPVFDIRRQDAVKYNLFLCGN